MGATGSAVVNFLGKFLFAALFVYFVTRVVQSIEKLELGESHYESTFETRNFVCNCTGVKDMLGSKVPRTHAQTSVSASLCLPGTAWTERRGNGKFDECIAETFDPRISFTPVLYKYQKNRAIPN